jgi:ribonuclease HI
LGYSKIISKEGGGMSELTGNIDGAARGNPGPAAIAYVFVRDGQVVAEDAQPIGRATNNVAEYTALVRALERAAQLDGDRLHIRSDSELLVRQMTGQYRVKNEDLLPLYQEAKELCRKFHSVRFEHVPRAQNARADQLCNQALDGEAGPTAPRRKRAAQAPERADAVREEAVACLRAAAEAWKHGGPGTPRPEDVWEQLWSVLQEHDIVR